MMGAIIAAPHSPLATTLSLFPLTAPVTMMIRAPLTAIAPWEIAVSIMTLTLSAALALWLAARLFRAGTLLAGRRLSMKAVFQALRTG
jgi:ABC-2 type transport system permease protein